MSNPLKSILNSHSLQHLPSIPGAGIGTAGSLPGWKLKDYPSLSVKAQPPPFVCGRAPNWWKASSLSWDNLPSVVLRSQVWSWESGRNRNRAGGGGLTTRKPPRSHLHQLPPCLQRAPTEGAGSEIRKAGQGRERDEIKLQSGPRFVLFEEGVGRTEPLCLGKEQECRCVRAEDAGQANWEDANKP